MYLVSLKGIICTRGGAAVFSFFFATPHPPLALRLSLSGPPTRPKFGCNPSRAGLTLRHVTGCGEKASAFFFFSFSEIECLSLCVFVVFPAPELSRDTRIVAAVR